MKTLTCDIRQVQLRSNVSALSAVSAVCAVVACRACVSVVRHTAWAAIFADAVVVGRTSVCADDAAAVAIVRVTADPGSQHCEHQCQNPKQMQKSAHLCGGCCGICVPLSLFVAVGGVG